MENKLHYQQALEVKSLYTFKTFSTIQHDFRLIAMGPTMSIMSMSTMSSSIL